MPPTHSSGVAPQIENSGAERCCCRRVPGSPNRSLDHAVAGHQLAQGLELAVGTRVKRILRGDRDRVEPGGQQPFKGRAVQQIAVGLKRYARARVALAAGLQQVEQQLQLHQRLAAGEDEAVRLVGQVGEHRVRLGAGDRRRAGPRPVVAMSAAQVAVVREDPVDGFGLHSTPSGCGGRVPRAAAARRPPSRASGSRPTRPTPVEFRPAPSAAERPTRSQEDYAMGPRRRSRLTNFMSSMIGQSGYPPTVSKAPRRQKIAESP